ncbi:peptidoglycan-binding protein [Kitasatospora sp. NBC_00315]|uniref:peptidoglycan-binding domain-containing protein n=1 Tax=Kitasatospora sp. NBC_00315 TaxID=2975963 RepID=UPI00325034DC
MPDQHCPVCGTVRTAGSCGCSPDLTDTTVLPHIEGPPLVRPYVPQPVGRVGAPPVGPAPDHTAFPDAAYPTTLLPPAPAGAAPPTAGLPASGPSGTGRSGAGPHRPGAAPGELGLFAFENSPGAAPPGRAARRSEQRGPLARHRGAILAAGAGVVVLGVGAAFLTAPSGSTDRTALPAPTLTAAPTVTAPVEPPTGPAEPGPSGTATGSTGASPVPAHSGRTAASKAPATTAATTAAPPAPAAPATPTATAASTAPGASPSPSAAGPVLKRDADNDRKEVRTMQTKLVAVNCGTVDKSLVSGVFDWWTQWVLTDYQAKHNLPKSEQGVYGPVTRASLESQVPAC